ncbi:hypothetical protein GCM10009821_01480 [Aeromicrobium halocynthiae]|uniref:CSD domain-containing protein n=1 Tax=Aeromicrobium halocynthiae TaxID=560557 RepID=A0ABN2VU95_9ACTN
MAPARLSGAIASWDDRRGYGFVASDDGRRLFVHVTDFPSGRRPEVGRRVTYTVDTDAQGRPCAVDVRYVGRGPRARPAPGGTPVAAVLTVVFLLVATAAALLAGVAVGWIGAFVAVSPLTFAVYATDKRAARAGARRTPESTLHLLGLLGGWPGGLAARRLLRHKTVKQPFRRVFGCTVAVNVGLVTTALAMALTRVA